MTITKQAGFTKKQLLIAVSGAGSLKDLAFEETPVKITGVAIAEEDNTNISFIALDDGRVFGTNSASLARAAEAMYDFIEEEGAIDVLFSLKKGKEDHQFIDVDIL